MCRRDGQLMCVFLLLCAVTSVSSCAGGPSRDGAPVAPEPPALPWRDSIEYRMLADASALESFALDFAGYTPLSAVAFARLALREDAAAAFNGLLRCDNPVVRLYGLKGLWLVDRSAYPAAAAELARLEGQVPIHIGCLVDTMSLKSLITEHPGASWSSSDSPVSLFRAGADWLQAADPQGTDVAGWDRHPCRLFAALVGETSEGRKGSSWGHVRQVFEAVEKGWVKRIHSGSHRAKA